MKRRCRVILTGLLFALSVTTLNAGYKVYRNSNNFVEVTGYTTSTTGLVVVKGSQWYQIGDDVYSAKQAGVTIYKNNIAGNSATIKSNGIYDSVIRSNNTTSYHDFTDRITTSGYITNTWVQNGTIIQKTENGK